MLKRVQSFNRSLFTTHLSSVWQRIVAFHAAWRSCQELRSRPRRAWTHTSRGIDCGTEFPHVRCGAD